MVRVASLFSQLLAHFPRGEFQEIVLRHGGDRRAKGFTCWTQFVSMLSATWRVPIRCERSATAWRDALASCGTWA